MRPDLTRGTRRVASAGDTPVGFVRRLAGAQFGMFMAMLAPALGGLSVKIQHLAKLSDAPALLGMAAASGTAVGMLTQPIAGWGVLVRDPLFRVATITGMMISAWLVDYLADSFFALQYGFGISPQQYAAVFAFCAMGITITGQINHRLLPRLGVVTMPRAGFVASAFAGAPLLLSLLADSPPLVPVIAGTSLPAFCRTFGGLPPASAVVGLLLARKIQLP